MVVDECRYEYLPPAEFRARLAQAPVAYLPLGTLEWHCEHLPLGTDALISHGFFLRLARRVGGIVLPPLFLGPDRRVEVDGMDLIGMDGCPDPTAPQGYARRRFDGSAYWISSEAFIALLTNILEQLTRAGFAVVVAHGHGPSVGHFLQNLEAWERQFGIRCLTCRKMTERGPGLMTDHAATNETSLVMALHPELVHMDRLPPVGAGWPPGVGGPDPRLQAEAGVGQGILDAELDRMAAKIRELLGSRIGEGA